MKRWKTSIRFVKLCLPCSSMTDGPGFNLGLLADEKKPFQELSGGGGGVNNLRQWLVESLIEEPWNGKKTSQSKKHMPPVSSKRCVCVNYLSLLKNSGVGLTCLHVETNTMIFFCE